MNLINIYNHNIGKKNGQGFPAKYKSLIEDDKLFSAQYDLICFQEMNPRLKMSHEEYGLICNKLNSTKKGREMRVYYNTKTLEVYEDCKVEHYRFQIIMFKHKTSGLYFVFINVHIPINDTTGKTSHLTILKNIVDQFKREDIKFIIVGDFNISKETIINTYKINDGHKEEKVIETTTGNNSYDHFLYSQQTILKDLKINTKYLLDNGLDINHYSINAKFCEFGKKYKDVPKINEIFKIAQKEDEIYKELKNLDGKTILEKIKVEYKKRENNKDFKIEVFYNKYFKTFCRLPTLNKFFNNETKKSKCHYRCIDYLGGKI